MTPVTNERLMQPQRMLTFRSGGWVLLVAALATAYAVAWTLAQQRRYVGDGAHPATYGFDLSQTLVPREQIVAAGFPKDALQALSQPATLTCAEADALKHGHSKFIMPKELVVGLTLGGQSRAYPLAILALHEIVNDTLGGQAIAVTYSPLCDSVVVFDRAVAAEVREFGVSGLLYNSNLLMFDRHSQRPAEESLWSQLQMRAVAGPAAAGRMALRPRGFQLASWEDWRRQHPDTTVLAGDPRYALEYPRSRYSAYFGTDELRFPVAPLWNDPRLPKKTRIAAVRDGQQWRVFFLTRLADLPAEERVKALHVSGAFDLEFVPGTQTLRVLPRDGMETPIVYCFLFAWYAAGHAIPGR